jgi:hypothetical protein
MEERNMTQWPVESSGYILIGPVGQGSFGLVWNAKCIDSTSEHNNSHVAIKIIDLENF